jgi:hypothetical protein
MRKTVNELSVKEIMQELANEDRDFNENVPMSSVIKVMSKVDDLDPDVMGKLWKVRGEEDTLFGLNYAEIAQADRESLEIYIRFVSEAMYIARTELVQPVDAIVRAFQNWQPELTDRQIYNLVLELSECESLAARVYWCPI